MLPGTPSKNKMHRTVMVNIIDGSIVDVLENAEITGEFQFILIQ